VAKGTAPLTATDTLTDPTRLSCIGRDPQKASAYFKATIGEVALYNVAVSAATVSNHFAAG
jgi:hypothetical protein